MDSSALANGRTTVPFNTGGFLFWAVVKHPVVVA
jgi:hypothetical protein